MGVVFYSRWVWITLLCSCMLGCFDSNRVVTSVPDATEPNTSPDPDQVSVAMAYLESVPVPEGVGLPNTPPIAAVYFRRGVVVPARSGSDGPPGDIDDDLIIVVWPNGQVVWSDDPVRGGPPYSAGQVSEAAVDRLYQKLSRSGAFEPSLFGMSVLSYCGGGGVQMIATDGSRAMKLSSVHELFDDKQSYCHTPEGRVWSKAKRHIFDLAGEAVSIRRILDEDAATARRGDEEKGTLILNEESGSHQIQDE